MNDYLTTDLFGPLEEIKFIRLLNGCYRVFKQIDCGNIYFMLNVQHIEQVPEVPYKDIIISFHTENFNISSLLEFFNKNKHKNFLLLSDGDLNENFWPDNVRYVKWITWGDQLNNAIDHHGIADSYKKKSKKLSSLSYRNEWPRATITGYLNESFPKEQLVLSWHNQKFGYNIQLPDNIKHYVESVIKLESIKFDTFSEQDNSAMKNGNWQNPAYTDCVFNLTNESFFNSHTTVNNTIVTMPTPYLTEKTWKPLLAGQALIPVGQFGTLKNLSNLGLNFDYDIDLSHDDCIDDFDRMNKIFNLLETIKNSSITKLENNILTATEHNLNIIKSEQFKKNCEKINLENFEKIKQWIDQAHSA